MSRPVSSRIAHVPNTFPPSTYPTSHSLPVLPHLATVYSSLHTHTHRKKEGEGEEGRERVNGRERARERERERERATGRGDLLRSRATGAKTMSTSPLDHLRGVRLSAGLHIVWSEVRTSVR